MLMNKQWKILVTITALLTVGIFSCHFPTEEPSGSDGTLSVLLTDAPLPIESVDAATVTIDSVVIRETENTGAEAGWPFVTLTRDQHTFNLLDLRDGMVEELAELEVPAGEYNLIRLYVSEASITYGGTTYDLFVPSGTQTGIKILSTR